MSDEDLIASLHGVVERRVERGVLHFGVDIHAHTQQEDDPLHVLVEHG